MSLTTTLPRGAGRSKQGPLVRLFDYRPFLILVCLAPALGLLLVFLTYPLGLGVWLAFTDTTIGRRGIFVGLENFQYLLSDPLWWNAVFYSVLYTGIATIGKFTLGFWLALLLNNHFPFKSILRAIVLLPWIVPTVLSALAFWWIYDPQFSIISYLLVDVLHIRTTNIDFLHAVACAILVDRSEYLARHSVRRDLTSRRPSDNIAFVVRGCDARWCIVVAAFPLHHASHDDADPGDRDDVLDHLHVYRLPTGLRNHTRRADQLDASVGNTGFPARNCRR